jgi:hypothetical protein
MTWGPAGDGPFGTPVYAHGLHKIEADLPTLTIGYLEARRTRMDLGRHRSRMCARPRHSIMPLDRPTETGHNCCKEAYSTYR